MCANFQLKRTTLTSVAQICQKMDLWLEIQKTNAGLRISIVKMRANFQEKWATLTFWAQICPKMDFGAKILKI